jgi:hypothetical protein
MLNHISSANSHRRPGAWRNLGLSAVMLLVFAVTASAYTLVFRNGERLDIPDNFTVTQTTLTYEISPGFNKTILLSLVDVPATERANRESRGSFFRRRESPQDDPQPDPARRPARGPTATKTLTNDDLVAIRQRRLESEKNYEARRKELGLPTVEETRRRQEAEGEILLAQIRENNSAKSKEESYWRGRARELRIEIATVDNQINYVRGRLNEVSSSPLITGSWTSTYPIWPDYRSRNGRWGNVPNRPGRPRTTPPVFGPQPQPYGYPNGQWPYGYPNGQNPYGYPNGQWPYGYPNGQYPYPYPNQSPYGFPGPYGYGYPNGQPYGYPPTTDNSAQAADLQYRLDDLLTKRAALLTQWRALEDEARDARIPQVWLEP